MGKQASMLTDNEPFRQSAAKIYIGCPRRTVYPGIDGRDGGGMALESITVGVADGFCLALTKLFLLFVFWTAGGDTVEARYRFGHGCAAGCPSVAAGSMISLTDAIYDGGKGRTGGAKSEDEGEEEEGVGGR